MRPGQADQGSGDFHARNLLGLFHRTRDGLRSRRQVHDYALLDAFRRFYARAQDADGLFFHPSHQGADFGRAYVNSNNNLVHRFSVTYRMVHPGIPR